MSLSMSVSVSTSTCRAQSDSMQENHVLVTFGKEDWKGWGYDNKGRKTGRGMRESQIWKEMWFLLSPKRSNVFCLINLSGSLFQKVGAPLWNYLAPECFSFVFSPRPLSLHREEEQREQDGLYWVTNSCRYCGMVLCTHWYVRFYTFSVVAVFTFMSAVPLSYNPHSWLGTAGIL